MADTKKPITSQRLFELMNEGGETPKSTPVSSQSIYSAMQNAQEREPQAWSDVATQAYTNVPESALNFAKGLYDSITNPKQTLSSISDLMQAGLSKVVPESMIDPNAKPAVARGKVAGQAMAEHFKERYGSAEGFKQALSKDPIGVASDISTVLSMGSGGAGAYAKLAELGSTATTAKIAKGARATEQALETAAKYTNPLTAVTSTIGLAGKPLLGGLTGTGSENIKNVAKAGFEGDKNVLEHLRGQAPINEPLENARHNLKVMRQKKSDAYKSGMVDVSNDKSVLDFADIDNAVQKARNENRYGPQGKILDEDLEPYIDKMEKKIEEWKSLDPAHYHTPEGLDKLKQSLWPIIEKIPHQEQNANRTTRSIYHSVKDTISAQAPKYADVMGDYSEASDQLKEIEKALSLGDRASADTALRKLQSVTRNNVNTNYGQRLTLAQKLEAEGGKPFINALSGQALSSNYARGLAGVAETGAQIAALTNPYTLAAIPFQTPRLVGEGLYAGGRAARKLSDFADVTGLNPRNANALADLLYTDQQTNPNRIELSNMLPNRP